MLLASTIICLNILGQNSQQSGTLPEAIRTSYAANRGSFQEGTLRLANLVGKASSADAARRGEVDPSFRGTGLLAFDRAGNARCDRLFSIEDMAKDRVKVGENEWIVTLVSRRAITDGKASLWHSIDIDRRGRRVDATEITPGLDPTFDQFRVPLNLANPRPKTNAMDRQLDDAIQGSNGWRIASIVDDSTFEGKPVVVFRLESERYLNEYLVDIEHGSIPIKSKAWNKDAANPAVWESYLDDIRPIDGAGWMPFRLTDYTPATGFVQQVVVEAAEFRSAPVPKTFELEFPEPIRMIDSARSLRYPARKTWDLRHLPGASAREVIPIVAGQPPPAVAPVLPGPLPSRFGWWWGLLVLGALSIGLACWRLRTTRA